MSLPDHSGLLPDGGICSIALYCVRDLKLTNPSRTLTFTWTTWNPRRGKLLLSWLKGWRRPFEIISVRALNPANHKGRRAHW